MSEKGEGLRTTAALSDVYVSIVAN